MHQPSIFVSSGLFAALFAAALLPAPAAFGFTFAKDGKASAAIVLPGGIGSLDEIVETHVLRKLGRYDGLLLALNLDGFYDPLKNLLHHYEAHGMLEARDRELIVFADTVEELAEYLK